MRAWKRRHDFQGRRGHHELTINNTELARQTTAVVGHHVRCTEGDTAVGTNVRALFKTLNPAEEMYKGFLASIKGVYRAWKPNEFQTDSWAFEFAATIAFWQRRHCRWRYCPLS